VPQLKRLEFGLFLVGFSELVNFFGYPILGLGQLLRVLHNLVVFRFQTLVGLAVDIRK